MKRIIHLAMAAIGLAAFNLSAATRYVWQDSPSPGPPYDTWANAAHDIQTAVDAALAGDEIVVTNGLYTTGGRAVGTNVLVNRVAVDKPVTVRSVNGPQVTVIQGDRYNWQTGEGLDIRCVYLAGGASLSGFTLTNGATRGGDYYPADGESSGGGIWCGTTNVVVSDCLLTGNSASYRGGGAFGGTLNNCTLTGNSADGAESGGYGGGAYGCALSNCTLTDNWASGFLSGGHGGGASGCTLHNCALTGNSAIWDIYAEASGGGALDCILYNCYLSSNSVVYGHGGGAAGCALYNCTLTGNSAAGNYYGWGGDGGGAYDCTLYNCTLTGNSSAGAYYRAGGGAYECTLKNCIVYFNTAPNGANYFTGTNWKGEQVTTLLNHSCTTPMPTNGVGNIDADPRFVDFAGGNLRLQPDSPCINAGNNAYVTNSTDLDGHPRISGGIVDIGAYEFVFTPSMEVARLILLVNDADLGAKNKQALLATLSAALASFERGNLHSGANQLHAFQNKVRAQVSRVDAALANELIEAAQQILDAINNQ